MISFVKGKVSAISEGKAEIDIGPLGYEVHVPANVLEKLSIGSETKLYTYLNVKEDELSLFGFLTKDALEIFRLLINVNGIGPKGALSILSAFTPSDLRFAIISGDAKTLSRAPGVGTKTAQRICIELKDKVSLEAGLEHFNDDTEDLSIQEENSARGEAVIALTVLGYSNAEALKAVNNINTEGKDVEAILKEALKNIGI